MSKIIDTLKDLIEDELEGAEEYAELALEYKMDKPDLAQEFCRKAEDELKHAMSWHEWVVKDIEKKKADMATRGETVPPIMLARWEVAHESFIEELNEIKRDIVIFKGM